MALRDYGYSGTEHAVIAALREENARLAQTVIRRDRRLKKLKGELARLRAVVDRLPKTADGAAMVPGGHYWAYCRDQWADDECRELLEVVWWHGGGDDCFNPEYTLANQHDSVRLQWEFFDVGGVYAAREAAEAAKENRE